MVWKLCNHLAEPCSFGCESVDDNSFRIYIEGLHDGTGSSRAGRFRPWNPSNIPSNIHYAFNFEDREETANGGRVETQPLARHGNDTHVLIRYSLSDGTTKIDHIWMDQPEGFTCEEYVP